MAATPLTEGLEALEGNDVDIDKLIKILRQREADLHRESEKRSQNPHIDGDNVIRCHDHFMDARDELVKLLKTKDLDIPQNLTLTVRQLSGLRRRKVLGCVWAFV